MPGRAGSLLVSNVIWDQGESVSLSYLLTGPEAFLSRICGLSLQENIHREVGFATNRLFSIDAAPTGRPYCLCPTVIRMALSLFVDYYYNEAFETIIITHSLELRWRPGGCQISLF